jgi:cell division protein FtsW (lipid II flippase)
MIQHNLHTPSTKIQSRLLSLAALFLFLLSIALTISPAAREKSWEVEYHWLHWIGFSAWCLVFSILYKRISKLTPDTDPYILPLIGLFSGWGLITIYRLDPSYGIRQTIWMLVSAIVFFFGIRLDPNLRFLRRYKYLLLTGGLILTACTLIFGTNPLGNGPRLWLGCCGLYLQPSEPLKILLIVFLAAYLADKLPFNLRTITLLSPTIALTILALLLLLFQRDLGTASVFIFLYFVVSFIATGKKRLLLLSMASLLLAGVVGYFQFDVVRLRVDSWLNPWNDPSGRSYQIIQSLMAVANGGLFGRGTGLGNPGLVPVAISDFIFSAIAEETGLIGTTAFLALLGIFIYRGMKISLAAPDKFRRYVATGLTAYIGGQAILIIGGNLRLLPLTGVTLPFISYGGSSLLTSFIAALLLLLISSQPQDEPPALRSPIPYTWLGGFLCFGIFAAAVTNGWWGFWRGPDLLSRTDNPRRTISDRFVKRGSLLDRHEKAINLSVGSSGTFNRTYLYPDLAPITGYTHPTYGQAGLEASLDDYLRGLQGNPASMIWWNHLLYGQPPAGLDVRLSLDLDLQKIADAALGMHTGAVVLLNSETGEILVMASHPTYDPNDLDAIGDSLSTALEKPLLNRASQGMYQPGSAIELFSKVAELSDALTEEPLTNLFEKLGFYSTPGRYFQAADPVAPDDELRISPLQMSIAVATLSNNGIKPVPRLAMAVQTPQTGWVVLSIDDQPVQIFIPQAIDATLLDYMVEGETFWEWLGIIDQGGKPITWYLAGTLPDWQGIPLSVVILLEERQPTLAAAIGHTLLNSVTHPVESAK